jgi:hypothetical protein
VAEGDWVLVTAFSNSLATLKRWFRKPGGWGGWGVGGGGGGGQWDAPQRVSCCHRPASVSLVCSAAQLAAIQPWQLHARPPAA